MSKDVLVTREVIEDLQLRPIGQWHVFEHDAMYMDRRRLKRELRRCRKRMGNTLARKCRTMWWRMFWRTCRKYGVRV